MMQRKCTRRCDQEGIEVLIGYHPFFLMNGIPTHYHRADGVAVTIQSYVHLFSEHYQAGNNAGLTLLEFQSALSTKIGCCPSPDGENICIGRSAMR